MRSGTSFFNFTVYKKTFLRFWPIWAVSLVAWGLILPLRGLRAIHNQQAYGVEYLARFAQSLGQFGGWAAMLFAWCVGLLAAMAVCSHLYFPRSANFMGALPIRREGLFLSHYLSGLTMLLAPNVVIFLLTALVEAAGGGVEWTPLLFWLAALSGMELFFYSFAVCLGQFTGHILALPAFYGIFNFLVLVLYGLMSLVVSEFCFGFYSRDTPELVKWLTPTLKLSTTLSCTADTQYGANDSIVVNGYAVAGLGGVGVYALAAVVLILCTLLLYRRRHLETAGDVVAVRPMRPVFAYGVAFCSGLVFGLVTTVVLELSTLGLSIAIVVWAVVGYFVAQMLLEKSFRVFRKWQGAVAVAAVFAALFLVLSFDLTGFERRVPEVDQVASVEIYGLDSYPYDDASYLALTVTDPEIIQEVVALHQAAVDQGELTDEEREQLYAQDGEAFDVRLCYTMENGTVMWRKYTDLMGQPQDINTQGTVEWAAWQLLNDRDLIWQEYGFDEAEALGTLAEVDYEDWDTGGTVNYFTDEEAQQLLEAVKADYADGNIGVRRSIYDPRKKEEQMLVFHWSLTGRLITDDVSARSVTIAIQDTATRTRALLDELCAQDQ